MNTNETKQGVPKPDDRLREVVARRPNNGPTGTGGHALAGFLLLKLNGYYKPPLAEELAISSGTTVGVGSCTCNSVCTCVPVQTCACDSVCTCNTVVTSLSGGGGGGGGGGGYGGYYAPCF